MKVPKNLSDMALQLYYTMVYTLKSNERSGNAVFLLAIQGFITHKIFLNIF